MERDLLSGRRAHQVGGPDLERVGKLPNSGQLEELAGFAPMHAHDAHAGALRQLGLEQRALDAPVAQCGGSHRHRTRRHRLGANGSQLVDADHTARVACSQSLTIYLPVIRHSEGCHDA